MVKCPECRCKTLAKCRVFGLKAWICVKCGLWSTDLATFKKQKELSFWEKFLNRVSLW